MRRAHVQKLGQTVYIQLWCLPMWRLLCGSEHAGPLRCGRRARTGCRISPMTACGHARMQPNGVHESNAVRFQGKCKRLADARCPRLGAPAHFDDQLSARGQGCCAAKRRRRPASTAQRAAEQHACLSARVEAPATAGAQVFDNMQARGVEADVVTCCSLISALERGGQWQLAEARARAAPGQSRSTPESASPARPPGASGPAADSWLAILAQLALCRAAPA